MTYVLHFLHSVGFGDCIKANVIQILVGPGPHLKPDSHLSQSDVVSSFTV